jgi:hypothetical protein
LHPRDSEVVTLGTMSDPEELARLRQQTHEDRKLFEKAADALAEIDRNQGLEDHHADVLAALRIRVEGKKRASLDELLTATGEISGKKGIDDALSATERKKSDWPEIVEQKKDWPGL